MARPYYIKRNKRKLQKDKIRRILADTQTGQKRTKNTIAKEIFRTKPYYIIYEERYKNAECNDDGRSNQES